MNRRHSLRALAALLVIAVMTAGAPALRADSLGADVIGLFPMEVGEFAYADLSGARGLPWFAQFSMQMLPGRFLELADFLSAAKIDSNTEIEAIAWAQAPREVSGDSRKQETHANDEFIGVVMGHFNPDSAQANLDALKLQTIEVRGYTLYPCGGGAGMRGLFFVFIDSNTAALGDRKMLERLLNVRSGQEQSLLADEKMMPLINQANGKGTFWGVFNSPYARSAIQQLVPQAANFPQSSELIGNMRAMLITARTPSNIASNETDVDFQAITGSLEDAATLSQILQAGLLYEKYQASEENPDLAKMLDAMLISARGDRLDISFSLTNDQIISLITHNTFVPTI